MSRPTISDSFEDLNSLWMNKVTHCPQGHPYDEKNTRIQIKNGRTRRFCRACHRQVCINALRKKGVKERKLYR